jgi:hypothetical protein
MKKQYGYATFKKNPYSLIIPKKLLFEEGESMKKTPCLARCLVKPLKSFKMIFEIAG